MKRSTAVAAIVVSILAAIAYYGERDDTEAVDPRTVFDVRADQIQRVEIHRDDGVEPVILERQDGRFRLLAPVAAGTDPDEVELLLSNLVEMRSERSMETSDDVDPETYGLSRPGLEVRFETTSAVPHGIRFGRDTITPSTQYAQRIDSEDVLVVADHLSNNLRRSAWELRDKSLFPRDDERVATGVLIQRASDTVALDKADGRWRVTQPLEGRGDARVIERLIDRVREAQMTSLPEPTSGDALGLEPAALRAELSFEEGAPIVLELGDAKSLDVYARATPGGDPVLVEGSVADELRRPPEAFVSKRLIDVALADMTALRVRAGERSAEIAVGASINRLLRTLSATEASGIVTLVPSIAPSYEIEIDAGEPATASAITFYEPREGDVYANRHGETVALQIPTEIWIRLDDLLSTALAQGGG